MQMVLLVYQCNEEIKERKMCVAVTVPFRHVSAGVIGNTGSVLKPGVQGAYGQVTEVECRGSVHFSRLVLLPMMLH